jgi:hypothetical protein
MPVSLGIRGASGWTELDLDQLAAEALKLVDTNKCEERDADMRARESKNWREETSPGACKDRKTGTIAF